MNSSKSHSVMHEALNKDKQKTVALISNFKTRKPSISKSSQTKKRNSLEDPSRSGIMKDLKFPTLGIGMFRKKQSNAELFLKMQK